MVSPGHGPVVGRRNPRGKSTVRHLCVWYHTFLEIRRRDAQDAENFISIGRNLDGKVNRSPRVLFKSGRDQYTIVPDLNLAFMATLERLVQLYQYGSIE